MQVLATAIPGVKVITPSVHDDDRGSFCECYHHERYRVAGIEEVFVQDNVSCSRPGVLRGLHYQRTRLQGKLVCALAGAIFDVAVDLRRGSPCFGQAIGVMLSASNRQQLYVPPGCAHGFAVLGDQAAMVFYKCSASYDPSDEGGVRWDDPQLAIAWPYATPRLSPRDAQLPWLQDAALPVIDFS
jgi:dTDP-4-dehydrorhamnose 3,5-epimerase